jgi:hypothetical protein
MATSELRFGIFGTFDVENYGDLLFPLIAEAELSRRLGPLTLTKYSYHEKSRPSWPFAVQSLTRLPGDALQLDGAIIGGGHVIRFDKAIAPGYQPPSPDLHHPTGYWLTPALVARDAGLPVVWNAPGVHGEVPAWARPLMTLAMSTSNYVSVRDQASRRALAPYAGDVPVHVVPDSAFGVGRLIDMGRPSAEFARLRQALAAGCPYIVVQASSALAPFARFVRQAQGSHPHGLALRDHRLVSLPVCPIHGDHAAVFDDELPGIGRLDAWPHPLLLAELIAHASAVVGVSLHLAITALAFGVPVFRPADSFGGKYAMLSAFEGVHRLDPRGSVDLSKLTAPRADTGPGPAVKHAQQRLVGHWDALAQHLTDWGHTSAQQRAASLFWSQLPSLLEVTPPRPTLLRAGTALVKELATHPEQLYEHAAKKVLLRLTAEGPAPGRGRRELGRRERLRTERSRSGSQREQENNVIDLARIERGTLATQPYEWAFIDSLFSPANAAALSASFPRDGYKTVKGYDGEKGYAYEARALIHMGAGAPAHVAGLSAVWRQLAEDLLAPGYRAALTRLLRRDLGSLPMEVNVFRYPPRAWLGPHVDLKDKLITHVFYFNEVWHEGQGGCLNVLRSPDMADSAATVPPLVGHSALLVRSEHSWHAVSPVVDDCSQSRLSMTVTFYRPGSVSTMWPPGDTTPLHDCEGVASWGPTGRAPRFWASLRPRIAARLRAR